MGIVEEQLIEAAVAEIKERGVDAATAVFNPGDSEVSQYLAAPGKKMATDIATGKPVFDVTVYSTIDGEPRPIRSSMLAATLKKKRADGKPAFAYRNAAGVTTAPVPEYIGGTTPCWFNRNSLQYAELSSIPGLETFHCDSAKLASEFDAELHVKNRHSRRYGMAKDYLERKEREEERAIRREEIAAMRALAGGTVGPATTPAEIYYCKADGCTRFFDNPQAEGVHRNRDHKD